MSDPIYDLEPDEDERGAGSARTQPAIRCRSCGSGLVTVPVDGICPECDCPIAGPEAVGRSDEDASYSSPAATSAESRSEEGKSVGLPPKCEGCGYDLRGHGASAKCPECGLPRRQRSKTESADPLYLMPRDVIVAFRNGTVAVMLCLLGAATAIIAMLTFGAGAAWTVSSLLIFSLVWVVCVWQVTPAFEFRQAVRRGFSDQSNLRRAARWMQFTWPAAALCVVLLTVFSPGAVVAGFLQSLVLLFVLAGLVGLIVLSILFEELADWSRDDLAEKIFRNSQWGIAIGALIVVVAILADIVVPNRLLTSMLLLATIPAAGLMVISLAAYIYALFSLMKSVTLSLMHAREYQDRLRRREQRLREQEEREERLRNKAATGH